jgi:hypothetical protein
MQLSRHSLQRLILGVALAAATAAGTAAPQAFASNGDPITVHHFTSNGALGPSIGFSSMTVLPLINPQPLPPRKGPPCLPCPMVQQG